MPETAPESPATSSAPAHRYTADLAGVLESRWQSYWDEHGTYRVPNPGEPGFDPDRPKRFVLDMFPYPSGVGLHVGHPLGYIATDIYARFRQMMGDQVVHPMGFDAFGLPAEQYAVEHGVHPRITTEKNIANIRRQLRALGLGYDWDRCVATTDVAYYRWTQWIFLQLYKAWYDPEAGKARPIAELEAELASGARTIDPDGRPWSELSPEERDDAIAGVRLAYLAEVPVNWCPALGTVLANEEVTNEGRSERGNHLVFKRPLRQWMLRITAYADRLIADLDLVDWPEPIKLMQRNWIGPSRGALIDFPIAETDETIRVFSTRPDTLFGATYMVLAPEHPLVETITTATQRDAVLDYRRQAENRSDIARMAEEKTKTGVDTGAFAMNPATGTRIPIWIADYVLMGYGTGAIMAVPAHDVRDWAFATAFDLPIVPVVTPPDGYTPSKAEAAVAAPDGAGPCGGPFTGDGVAVNSSNDEVDINGLGTADAIARTIDWLDRTGRGRGQITYKLRDWLFSRQRYWGEPFPILHAPDGRIVPVDESELPVALPELTDFSPEASDDPDAPPRPPLGRAPESWRIVERDGVRYERELNTMPQWAGSCWYYLRFLDPNNDDHLVAPAVEKYWMDGTGVDLYVGGVEHAVLHLLYARFWHKVLFDLGHVSSPEPFGKLFNQGYIQAFAYRDERGVAVDSEAVVDQDGRPAGEVQDQPGRKYFHEGKPVTQEYGKMGKSLKNAVGPDDVCALYGCDTLRLYEMYMGPLEASKPWNPRDIAGPYRFLQRAWRLVVDEETGALATRDAADPEVEKQLHRTIARVQQDVDRLSPNTAIAALFELVNTATAAGGFTADQAGRFARILSPFVPHFAEELWSRLGHEPSVTRTDWPAYDESMLTEDVIELPVQVQGKVRGRIAVPADADTAAVEAAARSNPRIAELLEGMTVRKVIVVPGKIVNIIVG